MADLFQLHPDQYININGTVIPLANFLQWEPGFEPLRLEDGGLDNALEVIYKPGDYRLVKAKDQRYIDLMNYPVIWLDGDRYISRLPKYIEAMQALRLGKSVTIDENGEFIIPDDLAISKDKPSIKDDGIDEIEITVEYPDPAFNAVIQWRCVTPDSSMISRDSTMDNGIAVWKLKTQLEGLHTVTALVIGAGFIATQFYGFEGVT